VGPLFTGHVAKIRRTLKNEGNNAKKLGSKHTAPSDTKRN